MNQDYNNGQSDQQNRENQQNQNGYGQQGYGDPYGTQGNPYGNPYGTQGNPYGNPYGTQGNPYGNPYGAQGNPYGNPYGTQGNPYGSYRPPIYFQAGPDDNARSCHTMGLLAVVFLFFSQILSIIFGAIALNYAKKSFNALGYECPEMRSGRTMGKVGLIIGSILTGLVIFFYIIVVIVAIAGAI